MSVTITRITRVFRYNGLSLPDIDTNMTPESIRDVYAAQYGELTTAEIIDHGIESEHTHVFEFRKQVGSKG